MCEQSRYLSEYSQWALSRWVCWCWSRAASYSFLFACTMLSTHLLIMEMHPKTSSIPVTLLQIYPNAILFLTQTMYFQQLTTPLQWTWCSLHLRKYDCINTNMWFIVQSSYEKRAQVFFGSLHWHCVSLHVEEELSSEWGQDSSDSASGTSSQRKPVI